MQKKKKKKKKKLLIMRTKSDQYYLFIFQNDQMAFEIENKTTKTNKCWGGANARTSKYEGYCKEYISNIFIFIVN